MRLTWDIAPLERKLEQAFRTSVIATTRQAIRYAPVREGTLRRSITFRMLGPLRAHVGVMAGPAQKYAGIQNYGGRTRPHEIRPRRAQALFWDGAEHPVKVVHHPGSRIEGTFYLQRAMLDTFFPRFISEARRLIGG